MSLIIALALALFVLPSPWNLIAVVAAALWELTTALGGLWWSQRRAAKVGVEALLGREVEVRGPAAPSGRCGCGRDLAGALRAGRRCRRHGAHRRPRRACAAGGAGPYQRDRRPRRLVYTSFDRATLMPSRSNCSRWPRREATADVGLLLREHEGDAATTAAGAPGATDTMDVPLVVLGRVVVDDVRDVRQVEAARGHVRRDEGRHLPRAEALQRPLARTWDMSPCMATATTSRRDSLPASRSAPASSVRRRARARALLQFGDQRVDLAVGCDLHEAMVDDLATSASSGRSTEKRDGLRVNARANTPTSPSSVAEKSIV